MTDPVDLTSIVAEAALRRNLRQRSNLNEADWTFWELRNLNMHRVVGLLSGQRHLASPRDLEIEIRETVARNFKRSWWRGLAYGIVVEAAPTAWTPEDLKSPVDIYENSKGVLQWVILASRDSRSAIGVHTWEETYLSPVYRDTLHVLTAAGYRLAMAVKGKDGLLKFLTGVSGLKGVTFPEFRDDS